MAVPENSIFSFGACRSLVMYIFSVGLWMHDCSDVVSVCGCMIETISGSAEGKSNLVPMENQEQSY